MMSTAPAPIDVWIIRLTDQPVPAEELAWLTDDERHKATQFARPYLQQEYRQVRVAVRRCLARYTGQHPADIAIERTPEGKPELTAPWQHIRFNLSHSHHVLAIAVGTPLRLGIDIEQHSTRRDSLAIAERYFHPHESASLIALPEAEQIEHFFRLWTLKEAFFKALGTGIVTGLHKAQFYRCDNRIEFALDNDLPASSGHWHFISGRTTENLALAIAIEADSPVLPGIRWIYPELSDQPLTDAPSFQQVIDLSVT